MLFKIGERKASLWQVGQHAQHGPCQMACCSSATVPKLPKVINNILRILSILVHFKKLMRDHKANGQ